MKGITDMKKITAVVLSAVMSAAIAMPVFAANFTDISGPEYSWAADAIDEMNDAGYITGYEDGTFRPDNEVTRLECIALFARAMGSKDEANTEILEMAHEEYDSLLSAYSLDWGDDEIVYMLYKGILTKSDLDAYLVGKEKNSPMKRYEAAIIITKALGGEKEAQGKTGIVLDYTDARQIPNSAVQYVYYASEAGIMNGMGDGTFSPYSSVLRSQMAVMLQRTVDATEYSFFKAKLSDIDTGTKTVSYTLSDGKTNAVQYTDNTDFRVLGVETQAKIMTTGVQSIFALSGSALVSVDALSEIPDETMVGIFEGYGSSSGVTSVKFTVNGEYHSYDCSPDITVTYGGTSSTLRSFKKGDAIEVWLSNGVITKISGSEKEITVPNVVIEDIIVDNDVKITISSGDDEYDGKTLDVDSNVKVKKNGLTSDLTKIYPGDTAELTLQYGVIKSITARSTTQKVDGTIISITIASPNSSMTVNVKGVETSYLVPADVDITVNGEEATLYDFRIGDNVKISTESDAITKIEATSTQVTEGSVTGTVTGVNTSLKYIALSVDGSSLSTTVMYTDKTTFISGNGETKKAVDIKSGQTLSVRGTVNAGTLVAGLVIIESEALGK